MFTICISWDNLALPTQNALTLFRNAIKAKSVIKNC
jgi:hypothetical protein